MTEKELKKLKLNSLIITSPKKQVYDFIKVIDNTNHGQGYERNLALKEAKGDYIFFLDSLLIYFTTILYQISH